MRLVAAASLIIHGIMKLQTGSAIHLLPVFAIALGILLLAGLWTPISGSLVVMLAMWNIVLRPGDPWGCIFFATLGAALVLLGPGGWSADARLFGWKRIDIRDHRN